VLYLHARHILAIEDADGRDFAPLAALPLPMEPGARFWAKTSDTEPQYWFVRGRSPYVSVGYVPAGSATLPVPGELAAKRGLVRLPDPKASEVTA
jgi:hypothetical protein